MFSFFQPREKFGNQLFRPLENVTRLDTFAMTVITFRSLIIETDDASAALPVALPVIEPIFEWMLASIDWPGKSPNHDFENCAILKIHAMPIHQIRAHVVNPGMAKMVRK